MLLVDRYLAVHLKSLDWNSGLFMFFPLYNISLSKYSYFSLSEFLLMLFCRHRSICFHYIKGPSQRQSDILTD